MNILSLMLEVGSHSSCFRLALLHNPCRQLLPDNSVLLLSVSLAIHSAIDNPAVTPNINGNGSCLHSAIVLDET